MFKNNSLPSLAWVTLSVGVASYLVCLGYQTTQSSDVSLQVANTKLEATKKLNDARLQSGEVKQYLDAIKAQNEAYNALLAKYELLANTHPGVRKLKPEIEQLQNEVVKPEEIQELQNKVSSTEVKLSNDITELVNK
jgi:hypothetical protein